MMKCLTNLAFDFTAGKGNNTKIDNTECMDLTTIVDNVMRTDTSREEEFDVETFLSLFQMTSQRTILGICFIT